MDKEVRRMWAHELAVCDDWLGKMVTEAEAYEHAAEMCKLCAPELVEQYVNWARWVRSGIKSILYRKQQIQDYLDGKIGLWW